MHHAVDESIVWNGLDFGHSLANLRTQTFDLLADEVGAALSLPVGSVTAQAPEVSFMIVECASNALAPPGVTVLNEMDCACKPGHKLEEGRCTACESGTFKTNLSNDASCTGCGKGKETQQPGWVQSKVGRA